jgi:type IV pilus biogenesis protein CpaD/CtpE
MNARFTAVFPLVALALLAGCAGPAPKSAAVAAPARQQAPAKIIAPRFYIITFDAKGIPHDRTHAVVDRERVRFLVNKGDIDQHTGIRIEVPKGITDRSQSIEAFARAQQVAKIFELLGFDAVVVVLAHS